MVWATERTTRPARTCEPRPSCLRGLENPELSERRDTIVETDLFDDLAVLETQHRSSREVHFSAGGRWKRARQKIREGRTRVRSTAFPLSDDVVPFGDQVRSAPELEIGEGGTEVGHEGLDVFPAFARFVERVFH